MIEQTIRFGVTEAKKAELESIKINVSNAQRKVELLQIVVDSLQDKTTGLEADLQKASSTLDKVTSNQNSMDGILNNVKELIEASEIALGEMTNAKVETNGVTSKMDEVVNQLIYSSEVINKLATLIIRRKAMNPLISDELITVVAKLGDDANNAVALSLIALKSSIVSQTSNLESDGISQLEVNQAKNLLAILDGSDGNKHNVKQLLKSAYDQAKANNKMAVDVVSAAATQLNEATVKLKQAQVKLNSLTLSLNAANAAALAS